MRVLTESEAAIVGGGDHHIEPLIAEPQSAVGEVLNDAYVAYLTFLERHVFPYIYYCF